MPRQTPDQVKKDDRECKSFRFFYFLSQSIQTGVKSLGTGVQNSELEEKSSEFEARNTGLHIDEI